MPLLDGDDDALGGNILGTHGAPLAAGAPRSARGAGRGPVAANLKIFSRISKYFYLPTPPHQLAAVAVGARGPGPATPLASSPGPRGLAAVRAGGGGAVLAVRPLASLLHRPRPVRAHRLAPVIAPGLRSAAWTPLSRGGGHNYRDYEKADFHHPDPGPGLKISVVQCMLLLLYSSSPSATGCQLNQVET